MLASIRRFFFGATWNKDTDFEADWEGRTAEMAHMIPVGSSVIEFGASRSTLRKYLPNDCEYLPTDISQKNGCTFLDLNAVTAERPPGRTFDVAFLAGVLEYVRDVPNVARYLFGIADNVMASYVSTEFVPNRLIRKSHGWINHYSIERFAQIFLDAGWQVWMTMDYGEQRIYWFSKKFGKDYAVRDDYYNDHDFIASLREVANSNLPDDEKLELLVRKLDRIEDDEPTE
jgi:methyltransferase family protein